MPNLSVYLDEQTFSRAIRAAEHDADSFPSAATLVSLCMRMILRADARGRQLRRTLDIPEL